MSSLIPIIPASVLTPANTYPKHPPAADDPTKQPAAASTPPQRPQAAASTALSPAALSSRDVSYVESLMGVIPAQKMEEILLKTGVPIPANLGPNIDTAV